jgi:hypothetical protein
VGHDTPPPSAGPDAAQLEIEAEPREEGAWMLRATLTRAGAVQSQASVGFFQQVEFFGDRWVPLGTAVTDAAGVASRLYSPTSNGDQLLVARFQADDGVVESERVGITVSGAVPFHPPEEPILPIVRAWAFPVGFVILVLVWLALAGILLRAVIGIARTQPVETRQPDRQSPPSME